MHLSLSAADTQFREEVQAFLAEHLTDTLRQGADATPTVFSEPDIGRAWQAILHARGWLGYGWPTEVGGCGWSPIRRYVFEKECALAGAPDLPILGLKLLAPVLIAFGTPGQKATYLPKILSGEHYWCQGFSEAGAGSDLANLKTRAVRDGDGYSVHGSKLWTTHAQFADHMFCLVRTDPAVKPQLGLTFLLIDMTRPGVTVNPIRTLAGDHEVNEVFLDGVTVGLADRVGEEGQGWSIAKFLLENERGGSCHAPKLLADLAEIRTHAGAEPDGRGGQMLDDSRFATRLIRLEIEAQALEMTELRILADIASGKPPGPQTSLVKMVASTLRQRVDQMAVSVFGYAGMQLCAYRPLYGADAPTPVHSKAAQVAAPSFLNSRAWTIFGGSNEIQRMIIAQTVLGLPRGSAAR